MSDCSVTGCERPVLARGYCAAHYRRKERGVALAEPLGVQLTPWARVLESAFAIADAAAEDDREYQRVEASLRMAIVRWIRANGWAKPSASRRLAKSVQRVAQDVERHGTQVRSGQRESSSPRQALREGQEREPRRHAEVGSGMPRAGRKAQPESDSPSGQASQLPRSAGRLQGGRGAARPRGAEAVRARAGKA